MTTNQGEQPVKWYGTTRAARAMEQEDRQRDLIADIVELVANHEPDVFKRADMIQALTNLDRRNVR